MLDGLLCGAWAWLAIGLALLVAGRFVARRWLPWLALAAFGVAALTGLLPRLGWSAQLLLFVLLAVPLAVLGRFRRPGRAA